MAFGTCGGGIGASSGPIVGGNVRRGLLLMRVFMVLLGSSRLWRRNCLESKVCFKLTIMMTLMSER